MASMSTFLFSLSFKKEKKNPFILAIIPQSPSQIQETTVLLSMSTDLLILIISYKLNYTELTHI